MQYDPNRPDWAGRDRFILSKGHAVPVLYAAMAEAGYFPLDELMTLRKLGSPLEGHPNMKRLPGIEASTGSLGQGLSIGIGHALACRLDGLESKVFVIIGDGEIAEGQVWEAFAAAEKYKLGSLTAIIDQKRFSTNGRDPRRIGYVTACRQTRGLRLAHADDRGKQHAGGRRSIG